MTTPPVVPVLKEASPAWYKRHKPAIAVVGALLSLGSYFGREQVLDPWKDEAERIEQAGRAYTSAMQINGVADLVPPFSSHVGTPVDPLSMRSVLDDLEHILDSCHRQSANLYGYEKALAQSNSLRPRLGSLQQELGALRSRDTGARTKVLLSDVHTFTESELQEQDSTVRELHTDVVNVQDQYKSLAADFEDEAAKELASDRRRARWTSAILAVVFILGLVLSLLGKLEGDDTELPET